jgi:hypothetical protein
VLRLSRRPTPQKTKLTEFHIMRIGATPARLVAVVRATDDCQNKRRRYVRAVFGAKDRRFPKRNPEIEAMYPGHLLPSSPQMLEELLRRSLELEQSLIIFLLPARSTKRKAGERR